MVVGYIMMIIQTEEKKRPLVVLNVTALKPINGIKIKSARERQRKDEQMFILVMVKKNVTSNYGNMGTNYNFMHLEHR